MHFYNEKFDFLLFSLLHKNLKFYHDFISKYFAVNIAEKDDLVLLPTGFKKPISAIEFLSKKSYVSKASEFVKSFIKNVIASTESLHGLRIEETIFVDFKVSLFNESRITNADVVATNKLWLKHQSNLTLKMHNSLRIYL